MQRLALPFAAARLACLRPPSVPWGSMAARGHRGTVVARSRNVRDKVPLEEEEDQEQEEEEARTVAHARDGGGGAVARARSRSPSDGDWDCGLRDRGDAFESAARRWANVPPFGQSLFSDGPIEHGREETGLRGALPPIDEMPDELYPPKNFAMVYQGVFRSAYPTKKSFDFLKKLGLKSVIYLCQEEYSSQVRQFYTDLGIQIYEHGVSGNKEPFVDIRQARTPLARTAADALKPSPRTPVAVLTRIPLCDASDEMIYTALQRLLDHRYHPILIHCNQGKHRTGSLVGCLRAVNHWSMAAIFDEYRRFAGTHPAAAALARSARAPAAALVAANGQQG